MEDRLDGVGLCGTELMSQVCRGVEGGDEDVFLSGLVTAGLGKQQSNLVPSAVERICQSATKSAGGVVGEAAYLVKRFNCRSSGYKTMHSSKVYFPRVNFQQLNPTCWKLAEECLAAKPASPREVRGHQRRCSGFPGPFGRYLSVPGCPRRDDVSSGSGFPCAWMAPRV